MLKEKIKSILVQLTFLISVNTIVAPLAISQGNSGSLQMPTMEANTLFKTEDRPVQIIRFAFYGLSGLLILGAGYCGFSGGQAFRNEHWIKGFGGILGMLVCLSVSAVVVLLAK